MSQVCQICQKTKMSGGNVSFSQRKTKKFFKPNLVKAKVMIDGKLQKAKVCAKCLKAESKTR